MALLKLFFVFSLVVYALNKKITVGHIFISAALLLGLLFKLSFLQLFQALINAVLAPHAITLTILVSLLLILSNSMQRCGNLNRMLEAAKKNIKSHLARLTIFPALIGLLPMPGGAIFSAPMVQEITKDKDYPPVKLVFINYWYRHIWEYWWPLYPGILLMIALSDISVAQYALIAWPLTVVAILLGLIYLPKNTQKNIKKDRHLNSFQDKIKLLKELPPIFIAIFVGFLLGYLFSAIFPELTINKELGLICSILLAITYIFITNKSDKKTIIECLFSKRILPLAYTALSIMVFKGLLDESGAIKEISKELVSYNIPLLGVCMLLPFITGLITGITIGFVGTSFPIVISLLQTTQPEINLLPYMLLAITYGFVGTLFSPLHLCLILTNEFFKVKQLEILQYLWIPCFGILLVGTAYFFILINR